MDMVKNCNNVLEAPFSLEESQYVLHNLNGKALSYSKQLGAKSMGYHQAGSMVQDDQQDIVKSGDPSVAGNEIQVATNNIFKQFIDKGDVLHESSCSSSVTASDGNRNGSSSKGESNLQGDQLFLLIVC